MKSPLRLVWLAFFLLAVAGMAQQVCPQPPALERVTGKNIFNEQQEIDLGDASGDSLARDFVLIDDPLLTAHMEELGGRLARYLPPNHLKFRFYLIDLPEVNAFSLAGGRIYVARKLVALTRSDDELAGVLAHEMGHIVTHQQAIQATRLLKLVLGVSEVRDRSDIYDKFQRLLENERRKPIHVSGESEGDQYIADQVALFAMARAGFAPQAYVDLWDRFNATHGKTGSWISDLFGQTKPEQKRLRELLKFVSTMPAECAQIVPASSAEFAEWQESVIASGTGTHAESLPGLRVRQKLALPLRPDVTNLRFSPDGKYLLAQDEGGIHVLTRDPFEFLFFIEAPDADKAFFSPDSKSVIFKTPSLRVESWDVASQKRTSVHEMLLRLGCLQSALSPDGKYLACLNEDFALQLVDVESGSDVDSKKDFFQARYNFWLLFLLELGSNSNLHLAQLQFSPDGRYFLAGTSTTHFAYDLTAKHEVILPSSIKSVMHGQFTFIDSERILGVSSSNPGKSPLLRFPSGERLQEMTLTFGLNIDRTPQGKYIAVGPLKTGKRGFMDLTTGKLNGIVKEDAGDIYANTVAYEEIDGRILLIDLSTAKVVAHVQLTQSHLGDSGAIAVSPDFHWLAASTSSRGAVWDIQHNSRKLVWPFNDGWFSDNDSLYADFPKHDKTDRAVVELRPAGDTVLVFSIGEMSANQIGPYLLVRTPAKEGGNQRKNWTYELRDFRSSKTMWTHHFPHEPPSLSLTPDYHAVLMSWPAWSESAKEELKQFPDLKGSAEREDMFYEVMDVKNSSVIGKLLVKTNKFSFQVRGVRVDGDWAVVQVSGDRVLTYSLSSGKATGHVFGVAPILSCTAGAFAVSSGEGEVDVYGLSDSQLRRTYKFPVSIVYKKFSDDGKQLFVLTRDQTAYVLDLNAAPNATGVVKATAQ